ncbi:MAG TPA: hypothetical protein VE465_11970 [Streptosporangiaceae bacterium]|nr:hypothetical protein [Streptosporangiaceae bacterium]
MRKGAIPAIAGAILAVAGLSSEIAGAVFLPPTGHLVGGIFGGIAAIGGVVLLVSGIRALRLRRWLARHGRRIRVPPSYVGPDLTTTVNGRHPYVVRAAFRDPATGRLYVASSEGVWADPKPALMLDPYVTVLFDPRKPRRCVVEL